MLFSSAHRHPWGMDFLKTRLLVHTQRQWFVLPFCIVYIVTHEGCLRRSRSSSVSSSAILQMMPSCTPPQDVIMAFSRRKVDCGRHGLVYPIGMLLKTALWPAMRTLQGMLHSHSVVHLRFCCPWRGTSESPIGWRACDGMGYSPGRDHGQYGGSLYVALPKFCLVSFRENSTEGPSRIRCVPQRLLPETPGRDQRAGEPRACAGWFQRRVLSGPMGGKKRSIADVRLRGCVCGLLLRAMQVI